MCAYACESLYLSLLLEYLCMRQLNNIGKDIPLGGKWAQAREGPGRIGLGGRKYLGRTLGPGQGGSQDYFTKKGARIIHIRQFDFHNVGTPFHYILLYTLYANIRRISFLCF